MSSVDTKYGLDRKVQELERELAEARQQQTGTIDILSIISGSTTDITRVFDAIARSAARLCEAFDVIVLRVDGDVLRLVAHCGPMPAGDVALHRGTVSGRTVIERRLIHIEDLQNEIAEFPEGSAVAQERGHRSTLSVPLLQDGAAIGNIQVLRNEVRLFSNQQIGLLKTFADQAVIAIQNARLFEEVQQKKRALTGANAQLSEALEQQTATADMLRVISSSPTDVQPVLDAVAENSARLCMAADAQIYLLKDNLLVLGASHGLIPPFGTRQVSRGWVTGRAIIDCRTIHVHDLATEAEAEYPIGREAQRLIGHRTTLATPLLGNGVPLGAILIRRMDVRPFSERQIKLLETFADQAVIAIENTRLFEEVQARNRDLAEALDQQTATAEVLKVISRSVFDLQPVLETLVENACRLCGADKGFIYRVEEDCGQWGAAYNAAPDLLAFLAERPVKHARNSVTGRVLLERRTIHVHDVLADPEYDFVEKIGVRTTLGVPMQREGHLLGVIIIYREEVRPFNARQIELVETFADQAVIAIENVRLFNDIAQKSRELEIASQHKSQFVANMSHELRTPLAAILGYAELMQEGFYEPLGHKSVDALIRIRSNGKHLLGLINTVLDIAKIESGQFTLNMSEYAIESVVETVRAASESLAQNKRFTLTTSVDKPLPIGVGDEQRLTQVLLNLVGNAIKFTDAGEVSIAAGARNGNFTVSVRDTGPGIPLDQQHRIFEQFHQVDSSLTKAKGGTGLGLAIAKQIVEMHGGRIWVESTLGKGSTFQMELPTRAEFRQPVP